jgi:hypothetical protein
MEGLTLSINSFCHLRLDETGMVNFCPLSCYVLQVRLAVESPVPDQVDVLHIKLLQAAQHMVEDDGVRHAPGQLRVPERYVRRVCAEKA